MWGWIVWDAGLVGTLPCPTGGRYGFKRNNFRWVEGVCELKLKRLLVSNVTSYKENTSFVFDDDLNILIGPNGGGKSNLQKIIAVVLSNYFIHQYDFRHNDNESLILPIELLNKRALESALDPFIIISDEENNQDSDRDNKQIIEIELAPCESDIKNIRSIHQNLKKIK